MSSSQTVRSHQTGPPRCRGLFRGVATPAVLCYKEPDRRIQSPLLGALFLAGSLWHKGAYRRTIPCMEANYPLWHKIAGASNTLELWTNESAVM